MAHLRIVLADDHTLVRSGIRALLTSIEGVEVVAEASDGREAVELVGQHSPHIAVMDIAMPELNGLDATAQIRKKYPHVHVLLLSMYSNEEYVSQALAVGAAGYMLKDAGSVELELAVRAVARGDSYLSPAVAKGVVAGRIPTGQDAAGRQVLTNRQREILQLVAEGYSTKEIAGKLDLSAKTVEAHRSKLMERLGIHDIAGLVRYAIRTGLVLPD